MFLDGTEVEGFSLTIIFGRVSFYAFMKLSFLYDIYKEKYRIDYRSIRKYPILEKIHKV